MQYKGYTTTPQFSEDDNIFFGVVQGVNDLITFDALTVDELHKAFEEAVDDYLDLCKRNVRKSDKPKDHKENTNE